MMPEQCFFQELKISWDGPSYYELMNEMFAEYIATDKFCDKPEDERREIVYHVHQMTDVLRKIDYQINND